MTGGLFHNASYRPAFEDRRARLVGDNVTIQIVENVTASQKSSSTVDRTSEVSAGVTALPFTSKTFTDKLGVGANSGNAFSGKGGTESANTFTGSITATVVDVLPNGHLVITGEKQIGVNQNVDVLRFGHGGPTRAATRQHRELDPGRQCARRIARTRRTKRSPGHGLAGPVLQHRHAVLTALGAPQAPRSPVLPASDGRLGASFFHYKFDSYWRI